MHIIIDRALTMYSYDTCKLINPRRACAARVTVLGLSVCVCVCVCLSTLTLDL